LGQPFEQVDSLAVRQRRLAHRREAEPFGEADRRVVAWRDHAYDPPRSVLALEPFERRGHRLAAEALAAPVVREEPAGLGRIVEILAEPAPRVEYAAIADQLLAAAQPDHEGAVAVEQPAAGVAGEALEVVCRLAEAPEEAARLLVRDDSAHRQQVGGRRQPQFEPLGDDHRSLPRSSTTMVWMTMPTRPPTSVPLRRMNWRSRLTAPSIRSVTVRASHRRTVSETSWTICPP